MDHLETSAKPKIIFVIYTEVDKVEKINEVWYAHFHGSWESLAFGADKPFDIGDVVKISFERIAGDQPNQPSE